MGSSVFSSSVQSLSCVWLFATPWTAAHQGFLSITNYWSLLKLVSVDSVMPSNHLIHCFPFSSHVQSFPASGSLQMNQFFSSDGQIIGVLAHNSPLNEHSGLISFRMDWLDPLAVQGTRKSLRQHHSSKASILQHSAFFTVQLSHPYLTTGKTIALTKQTFIHSSSVSFSSCQKSPKNVPKYLLKKFPCKWMNSRVNLMDFSSVAQSCQLFATPWTAACQASLSFTTSQSLLKLMSIESVMPSTISSSVVPFSSCLQSFSASGSFLMSWLLASGS